MKNTENIKNIFEREKIEYFSIVPVEKAEIINSYLMPDWAKNVIVFLIPYRTDRKEKEPLAHFARIRDYHCFSKELFRRLSEDFKQLFGEANFKGYADHSPINERKLAFECGLGDVGKNGLIINEKYGSYVFIGEIYTDIDLKSYILPAQKLCTDCRECISSCPKQDVCISEISQKKKKTEEDFLVLQKNNVVWGCDRCQESCPLNKNASLSPLEYFYQKKIASFKDIIFMDEKTFKNYSFSYRKRSVIEENVENILKKHID